MNLIQKGLIMSSILSKISAIIVALSLSLLSTTTFACASCGCSAVKQSHSTTSNGCCSAVKKEKSSDRSCCGHNHATDKDKASGHSCCGHDHAADKEKSASKSK